MGTTYMDFGTGVFHVDGDAPLTQAQVDSVWRHLPTTGASWVERGRLFAQQSDGAPAFNLGPVERGVKGVSADVRRNHATKKKPTAPSQLDREIAEALSKDYRVTVRVEGAPKPVHVYPWMTRAQAEHAAKNHKALIRDRGWTQVVEIEDKSGAVTRLPR